MVKAVVTYYLFDERACGGIGVEDAMCLATSEVLTEVEIDAGDFERSAIYKLTSIGLVESDPEWVKDMKGVGVE